MGRAIVRDPQVFLFDEPLSNLDAKLRVQMRTEIKELHQRLKTTTVYVTHDQIEAMTMADKIVVMHDGLVEQIGAPLELYDRPANLFVAGFIGSPAMNFLQGHDPRATAAPRSTGRAASRLPLAAAPAGADGRPVVYGIRPEHFAIADDGAEAEVEVVEPTGSETQVVAKLGGEDIVAVFRERHQFKPGDKIRLKPDPRLVHLFDDADRTTTQRLNTQTEEATMTMIHSPHPGEGRHRAGRRRRAGRPGACSNGPRPGRRPRRGSRRRARSSRCCAGSASCRRRTTPS